MSPASTTVNNPIHLIWQVLDSGDLWRGAEAAQQIELALAALEQRQQKAGRAGISAQQSNYLAFLRRSLSAASGQALARAG